MQCVCACAWITSILCPTYPSWIGHLIVDLAQSRCHFVGNRSSHNNNVRLTRWRTEHNTVAIHVVTWRSDVHHLYGAAGQTECQRPDGTFATPIQQIVETCHRNFTQRRLICAEWRVAFCWRRIVLVDRGHCVVIAGDCFEGGWCLLYGCQRSTLSERIAAQCFDGRSGRHVIEGDAQHLCGWMNVVWWWAWIAMHELCLMTWFLLTENYFDFFLLRTKKDNSSGCIYVTQRFLWQFDCDVCMCVLFDWFDYMHWWCGLDECVKTERTNLTTRWMFVVYLKKNCFWSKREKLRIYLLSNPIFVQNINSFCFSLSPPSSSYLCFPLSGESLTHFAVCHSNSRVQKNKQKHTSSWLCSTE